jgi:hypothetical protein
MGFNSAFKGLNDDQPKSYALQTFDMLHSAVAIHSNVIIYILHEFSHISFRKRSKLYLITFTPKTIKRDIHKQTHTHSLLIVYSKYY